MDALIKPELLAPAGTFESLHAAFTHGADAVYLGMGTLNLRAYSENFSPADLPEIMAVAKEFNGKVYLVLNTMPNDEQITEVASFLHELKESPAQPSALIVSDPGVIRLCRKIVPHMELHLSTQTGTFNAESLRFWSDLGVTRVVLPREFTLDQIAKSVRDKISEIEVFVHGAMCVSVSGRCLMGAYINGRHPTHGECSQPCRFSYDIVARDGAGNIMPDKGFSVEEENGTAFIFNSKDLNTIEILPELIKTGVHSLKIEGRNKSVHYVSSVVKAYRAAIDGFFEQGEQFTLPGQYRTELEQLDHRPYTTGFIGGDEAMQATSYAKEKSKIRVVGVVKDTLKGGVAVVDVKNPFTIDEPLSILPVNRKIDPYELAFTAIEDLSGHEQEKAITNRVVCCRNSDGIKLKIGDMIRRVL
jgi:putative protease